MQKKTIIIMTLLFLATFANACPKKTFIENAGDTFKPLFQNPPDISGSSMMPFVGKVISSSCSSKYESCRVIFGVEEIFFTTRAIFEALTGIKEPPTTTIAVTIDDIVNAQFLKNSKWLIIAGSYSERDGEGDGLIAKASCGLAIAKYENGNFIVNNGELKLPYQKIRDEIMRPVTSEGVKRLNAAFSDLWLQLQKPQ